MALNHESSGRPRECSDERGAPRTVPLLLNLWQQMGIDFAPKRVTNLESSPDLFAALESEIIPRLMIVNQAPSFRAEATIPQPVGEAPFSPEERGNFLEALISIDAAPASQLVERYLVRGFDPIVLLTDLFTTCARDLGAKWERDEIGFVDVTIGVCRLHEAIHRVSESSEPALEAGKSGRLSILLAAVPGEQHVLGALIAAEQFRRDGWTTSCLTSGDQDELLSLAESQTFDIIGLSAASEVHSNSLRSLVARIRRHSRNPDTKVILGGNLFDKKPEIALNAGADGVASPAMDPVGLARKLLAIT